MARGKAASGCGCLVSAVCSLLLVGIVCDRTSPTPTEDTSSRAPPPKPKRQRPPKHEYVFAVDDVSTSMSNPPYNFAAWEVRTPNDHGFDHRDRYERLATGRYRVVARGIKLRASYPFAIRARVWKNGVLVADGKNGYVDGDFAQYPDRDYQD